MPVSPYPAPPERTARRLEWQFLPPHLRTFIERRCGSAVAKAISQDSGFTPGFASILVCEDGSRHFVKAASVKAQRPFADAYREETRKLAALPRAAPAPRLLWHLDEDWVVVATEYAPGRAPRRPWDPADLDPLLDALELVAEVLTPAPAGLDLDPAEADLALLLAGWESVRRSHAQLPHLGDVEDLARRFAEVVSGDTVVHSDIRADNVIVGPDGDAMICDWNWPVRGCDWFDSVAALIGPHGDGIDVETIIGQRRLLRDVPADAIDVVIALHLGYFWHQSTQPVPPTSPHLREHQRWQGEACWDWLARRRGWL